MNDNIFATTRDEFQDIEEYDRMRLMERERMIAESDRIERETIRIRNERNEFIERFLLRVGRKLAVKPLKGGVNLLFNIDGNRVSRRFFRHDTIQTLYDFVSQYLIEREGELPEFTLFLNNIPRQILDNFNDYVTTVQGNIIYVELE